MKAKLTIFLILALTGISQAQYRPFYFLDARAKSLGGASATLAHSAFSFLWNPASLALNRQPVFSLNINRTFSYNNAAIAEFFPEVGTMGLVLGRIADSLSTDYGGIGWAKSYYSGVSTGVGLLIFERENRMSPEFSFGVSYVPGRAHAGRLIPSLPIYRDRIRMAAVLRNMAIGSNKLGSPLQLSLGMSYETIPARLRNYTQLQFDKERNDFILGMETNILTGMIRTGIVNFDGNQWLWGAGVALGPIILDVVYERFEKRIQFSTNIKFGEPPQIKGEDHFQAGIDLLQQQNIAEALPHFRSARAYVPDNPNYRKAHKLVEDRENRLRIKEQNLLQHAQKFEQDGQNLKAILIYHDLLRQFPSNEIATRKVQFLRSVAYRDFTKIRPKVIKYYEDGDLVTAKKLFDRISAVFPGDTVIQRYKSLTERELRDLAENSFLRGLGYYGQNDLTAAQNEFERVKEYDPTYPEIERYLVEVRDRIKAREAYIDSLLELARKNEESQELTEAIGNYDEILRLDQHNLAAKNGIENLKPRLDEHVGSLIGRAESALDRQNYRQAEALTAEILAIQPESGRASTILSKSRNARRGLAAQFATKGDSAITANDPQAALRFYRQAGAMDPGNGDYQSTIIRIESRIKRDENWRRARDAFAAKDFALAERLAVQLLSNEPERQEIAQFLSNVVNARDREVTFLLLKGVKLYSQELYAEAVAAFDELLKIQPDNQIATEYRKRTNDKIAALNRLRQ